MKRGTFAEAQAWRIVAARLFEERDNTFCDTLCDAIEQLFDHDRRVYHAMNERVDHYLRHTDGRRSLYAYDAFGPKAREARAMAALWMACEAEAEAEAKAKRAAGVA